MLLVYYARCGVCMFALFLPDRKGVVVLTGRRDDSGNHNSANVVVVNEGLAAQPMTRSCYGHHWYLPPWLSYPPTSMSSLTFERTQQSWSKCADVMPSATTMGRSVAAASAGNTICCIGSSVCLFFSLVFFCSGLLWCGFSQWLHWSWPELTLAPPTWSAPPWPLWLTVWLAGMNRNGNHVICLSVCLSLDKPMHVGWPDSASLRRRRLRKNAVKSDFMSYGSCWCGPSWHRASVRIWFLTKSQMNLCW